MLSPEPLATLTCALLSPQYLNFMFQLTSWTQKKARRTDVIKGDALALHQRQTEVCKRTLWAGRLGHTLTDLLRKRGGGHAFPDFYFRGRPALIAYTHYNSKLFTLRLFYGHLIVTCG